MAAFDEFDDPYRNRVMDSFNPGGGVAGPQDFGAQQNSFGAAPAPQQQPGGYDLEAFRKRWMQTGAVHDASGWLNNNRDITQGVTLRGEKAYDPSGRFIADLVGNFKNPDQSQHSRIFLDHIDSSGKPRVAKTSSGMLAPGGKGSDTVSKAVPKGAAGGGAAAAPAANPFLDQIRQQILARLGQMQQQPSMDDPALAAQSAAYSRARGRGAEQERAAMAERAAAQGLLQGGASSGAFDTDLRSIQESAGEDVAANDASLIGAEVQQRRAEVQSLLNMALQSGDAESARQLQAALANLDAQLRRESMKLQDKQFGQDLGYRNRALAQSGRQFDDTFGRTLGRDYEDDYRWRVMLGL